MSHSSSDVGMVMIGSGSIKNMDGLEITPQPFPSLSITTLKFRLLNDSGILLISNTELLAPLYIVLSVISNQSITSVLDCHWYETTGAESKVFKLTETDAVLLSQQFVLRLAVL